MNPTRNCLAAGLALAWCAAAAPAEPKIADDLMPPVKIEANGGPIDVEIGHSAPFVGDFDGDGKLDLLVGQFGEGKLRIYKNVGTNEQPKFDDFVWFKAGADFGTVPYG